MAMSGANPFFKNRVRYRIYNPDQGERLINDPEGWNTDEKELSRHKEYHGIFAQFSNALTFVGNGADYIRMLYKLYGVEARLRLTRDEADPHSDLWVQSYQGDLDLSTMEVENGKVKVKFNNAGFEAILKSREGEQVEIERSTSIDGKTMLPIRVDTVALNGRRILLNSGYAVKPTENVASIYMHAGPNSGGTDKAQSVGAPMELNEKSHTEAQSILSETTASESDGTNGIMFFAISEKLRVLNIKLSITFTSNVLDEDDVNHGFWGLFIGRYLNGIEYDMYSRTQIWSSDDHGNIYGLGGDKWANPFTGVNENPKKTWHVDWEGAMSIGPGESLSLEFYSKVNLGGTFHDGTFACRAEDISGTLKISENSNFEPSQSKFILSFDLASRLIEIMTGANTVLRSNFLGRTDLGYPSDGKAALNGFTHGFWVRGFDALPPSTEEEINSYKPLTTSWSDFMTSMQAVWNMGLGLEKTGYKEFIRLEEQSYFFRRQVTIRLPNQIQKVKRTIASEYYYSGLELGYAKGGEYQEALGLDEYNGKSTFTTYIKRLKNTFSRISIYRADSYGKEFARRKSKLLYPTEDTQYDNDIFIMDLKRGTNNVFQERLWQDDFEQEPTGTYSPETATNLRFSPFNMLLRQGWLIAASLVKYPSEFIRYGSSTANSALTTRLIGGEPYSENGSIQNSKLQRARYVPEYIEFEHLLNPEIMEQIEGVTIIDGEEVPSFYGLIEFKNEDGDLEKGYLITLKPNENKFKLLISNT